MKLATFRVQTDLGPFDRLGVVLLENEQGAAAAGAPAIIDVNFAFAGLAAERGKPYPNRYADALCPADLNEYLMVHGTDLDPIREALEWAGAAGARTGGEGPRGPRGERVVYPLAAVTLRPPLSRIPVLRDFAAFEEHLQVTFGKMGIKIPPAWYRRPMAFKGNPTALVGQDEEVIWPAYTEKLDYEMEVAAVIGRPTRNVSVHEASEAILGYTILNDFSARDVQSDEMSNSTGPFKGKDFAWGLGPWIVTRDEIPNPGSLHMQVRINGEVIAESTPGAMQWTFDEMIAYTSQDETLQPGDVFGSGTVNGGCGFEIDHWLKPGDLLEVEVERIGVLRNRIGSPQRRDIQWKR